MPNRERPQIHPEWPLSEIRGRVTAWLSNDAGSIDGFVLDDDAEIKFPPHRAGDVSKVIQIGDDVLCRGRIHRLRGGDVHIHAGEVVGPRGNLDLESELPPPLQRPPGFVMSPSAIDDEMTGHRISLKDVLDRLASIEAKLESIAEGHRDASPEDGPS